MQFNGNIWLDTQKTTITQQHNFFSSCIDFGHQFILFIFIFFSFFFTLLLLFVVVRVVLSQSLSRRDVARFYRKDKLSSIVNWHAFLSSLLLVTFSTWLD